MKASKQAANYRSGSGDHRCANCTMFRPPHDCTAVEGAISPNGVCDYFKAITETDYSRQTICVYDNGIFPGLAVRMAKDFGRVLYYTHWESSAKSEDLIIGKGLPGVTRIENIWDHLDDIDLFVFPDVGDGALQLHLEAIGKKVFGSRKAEELELYRAESKRHLKQIGLPVGPYATVTGFDALREYLKRNDDRYVKISATRGDMESFHAPSYDLIEPRLDELEHKLGAKKRIMQFIVEEPISPAIEIGYDGFTIDGQFPDLAMVGLEVKDKAYVGRSAHWSELPEQVTRINEALAPTLQAYKCRSFFSTELRVKPDGEAFLIDPCLRCGCPPSETYHLMFANMAEIIAQGSEGKVVNPEFRAPWAAQLFLLSEWTQSNWQAVSFPEELIDYIKLSGWTRIDGQDYVVPQGPGATSIGSVVAIGNSMDDALQTAKDIADEVKGYGIHTDDDALDNAKRQLDELEEAGLWLKNRRAAAA